MDQTELKEERNLKDQPAASKDDQREDILRENAIKETILKDIARKYNQEDPWKDEESNENQANENQVNENQVNENQANESQANENNSIDSIDSNIEFLNEDELDESLENKENVADNLIKNKVKITADEQSAAQRDSSQNLSFLEFDRSHLDLDRSKTSIDDLSFSQKTLIKSCSLRSLITDLINDEILLDKNELSKDLDELEKEKFFQIIKVIKQEDNERKVEQLRDLCIADKGLILSDLRRIVWPIITNSHHINPNHQPDKETIENHPMYSQVIQDVNRTIKRFPPSIDRDERLSKEKQLIDLIMRILIDNPQFHYYQGYHDICITFLLLLGEEKAFHVVNKISQTHLSQFMEETMHSTQMLLELIPVLLEKEDKELADFLDSVDVGTIFSLSWVITWFSHILVNNRNVERLFDIFIATDYRLPVYFTVAVLMHHRDQILETEKDMALVFQKLVSLFDDENQFPFETLLKQGLELLDKYPPDSLVDEQKRRMSLQKLKDEELRAAYARKQQKNKGNSILLTTIKENKVIIVASVIVAIGALSFQFYKSQT